MQTDQTLKVLTALRGADLLPLLGLPSHTLLEVVSRELPARSTFLDTVLRVRSPQGQDYLVILEWQGYVDRAVLWRLAGYCAWFGQREPDAAIIGVVVYLAPAYDRGSVITQLVDGQVVQQWTLRRVALWEQDAQAALASGRLGLVVLSPLMQSADAALVETAVQVVLQQAAPAEQADLLAILGALAVPLFDAQRFITLVGRNRLMESQLFERLFKDREDELQEQMRQQQEQMRQQQEQFRVALQQLLEDTLMVRFPTAPIALVGVIRQIEEPATLRRLIVAVQQVPDLAAAEQVVRATAQQRNGA